MSDFCDPMDCSLPGSSVHGIPQARILEWVAISFSKESSQPRNQTWVSCIAGRFFTDWAVMLIFLLYSFFLDFTMYVLAYHGSFNISVSFCLSRISLDFYFLNLFLFNEDTLNFVFNTTVIFTFIVINYGFTYFWCLNW